MDRTQRAAAGLFPFDFLYMYTIPTACGGNIKNRGGEKRPYRLFPFLIDRWVAGGYLLLLAPAPLDLGQPTLLLPK